MMKFGKKLGNRTEVFRGTLPATLIIALLIASCIAFVSGLDARCFGSALSSDSDVEGKDNAYNSDAMGIPPFVFYGPGDRPPIMAAQRVGSGAVVAAGMVATCRNGRWNDTSPQNPAPYLDVLFDVAFQWMVPGAENVLWYEGYGVYVDTTQASQLIDNLTTLGYTVWGDSTEPISSLNLGNVDILVIPQLQLGSGSAGGDPSLLPAADVDAIVDFVEAGGGLLIMDRNDTFGYNYNKVHNKILEALGSDWWFQHDEVLDDVNNWGGRDYQPIAEVDPMTSIGGNYKAATGTDNIGLYDICSLAPPPTFSADVSISPGEQSGTAGTYLTFTATVHNTGTAWDTYTLDLTDDLGWPELSFLPKIATAHIYPTDAACVGDANGDWVIPSYDLFVGTSATGENWRTFLKFDISSIPSGAINSAALYAYPYFSPYPYDDNITVDAKRVDNDDWDESTITWNNAPWDNVGAVLDSDIVTVGGGWGWNDWDVTSFVAGECAGDGVASILLQSENEGPPGMYVNYKNDPYLEVTYLGLWTTTTVTLGPDESATFDLGITIDPAAPYCTKDTLTVVATSAYTETVVGTGSAKAHSMGVTRDDLFSRIMEIKGEWPLPGADQDALFQEIMDIKGQWPIAPS